MELDSFPCPSLVGVLQVLNHLVKHRPEPQGMWAWCRPLTQPLDQLLVTCTLAA